MPGPGAGAARGWGAAVGPGHGPSVWRRRRRCLPVSCFLLFVVRAPALPAAPGGGGRGGTGRAGPAPVGCARPRARGFVCARHRHPRSAAPAPAAEVTRGLNRPARSQRGWRRRLTHRRSPGAKVPPAECWPAEQPRVAAGQVPPAGSCHRSSRNAVLLCGGARGTLSSSAHSPANA